MQIVALAILGLILIVVGFILQFVLPDIKTIGWGIIALGVILLSSSFVIEFRRVRSALISHRGKYSASTSIMISVVIGIVLLVNAAGANAYKGFDLTGISQFTITSQTKDVLKNLSMPIDVICFFVPKVTNVDSSYTQYYTTARQYAPALLAEYSNYTNKLNIKVYDPEQYPDLARQYGLASEYYYQSVVFKTSLGWKLVSAVQIYAEGENAFTSAILQVTGTKMNTVYFLTGHGEASSLDSSDAGYTDARTELRNNLFQVQELDLSVFKTIPEDCTLLIVAGPTSGMTEDERNAIIAYLDNNGKAIFMTNPNSPDDIAKIGALWGFDVKNGTIIDPDRYATPNITSITFDSNSNWYAVNGILNLSNLYFPGLTAVELADKIPQYMTAVPLLITSTKAWMTNNYDPTTTPQYDPTKDFKPDNGIIGALVIEPDTSQNTSTANIVGPSIAIIGDSDFATNKNFYNGDNGRFFLEIVSQFTVGIEVTKLETKTLQTRRLVLTPEKSRFLTISSIALLPTLVLIFGFIVWWRRR